MPNQLAHMRELFPVWQLVMGVFAITPALAAEPAPASDFKLNLALPSVYQLSAAHAQVPERSVEPVIPAHLAEQPYAIQVQRAALAANLDPALVHAVIFVESGYNQAARSPKGAIGLMQLMPDTALRYGVRDPAKSPEANLKAGTLYLRDLMRQFGNRLDLVLAAYNAGENAVVRYGQRIPPYAETRAYVPAVLSKYREWREPPPAPAPAPANIEYLSGTRLEPNR